jgi:hypothetical protein
MKVHVLVSGCKNAPFHINDSHTGVSGQPQATAALLPAPIEHKPVWATEPVWTFRSPKFLLLPEPESRLCQSCSLSTTPTTLSHPHYPSPDVRKTDNKSRNRENWNLRCKKIQRQKVIVTANNPSRNLSTNSGTQYTRQWRHKWFIFCLLYLWIMR